MMMNLFSVFDPCVLGYNFFMLILLLVFVLFLSSFYLVGGGLNIVSVSCNNMFYKIFEGISFPMNKGVVSVGVGIFLFVFYNNFIGLFSYIFNSTSHISVTLGWGLVLWLVCVLMGWLKNFKSSLAHLVPEGAPLIMSPLLVCIELVSHVIRPVTLSVRLAANMMAGHLIIGLIASISEIGFNGLMVSVFLQLVLMFLEVAVSMIQGLVFSILVLLYAMEYY